MYAVGEIALPATVSAAPWPEFMIMAVALVPSVESQPKPDGMSTPLLKEFSTSKCPQMLFDAIQKPALFAPVMSKPGPWLFG